MRVLFLTLLLGCSASGSDETSSGAKRDGAADVSDYDDVAPDAIFPADDGGLPPDDAGATLESGGSDSAMKADACDCIEVPVSLTDCGSVSCPASHPYPVGCALTIAGSDSRGCVVHAAGSSVVAVKEGSSCSGTSIVITGTLTCSTSPGAPLDGKSCPMNKLTKSYVSSLAMCP